MPGQLQLARAIPSRPGSTVGPEQECDVYTEAILTQRGGYLTVLDAW